MISKKNVVFGALLLILICGVGTIFWTQQLQYELPTPIPTNYQIVTVGSKVELLEVRGNQKPKFIHFFNPDCPCSRFNFTHFAQLVKTYQDRIDFMVVLQVENPEGAVERFRESYGIDVPAMIDTDKSFAKECGVYSTPQAVVLTTKAELYFRGNYNRSRYCTDLNSNFAQQAIDSLLSGQPSPQFPETATISYGCELPKFTPNQLSFNLF